MQVIKVALRRVIDFPDRTSHADRDAVEALYSGMDKLDMWGVGTASEDNIRFAEKARKALDLIEAQREKLEMASTPEDYRDIRQAARIVLQAFERRAGIRGADRDSAMAANVVWLVEDAFPNLKIVLWAHNGHVAADMESNEKGLGHHLRARYGDQMVVLGFATHEGEVRAKRVENGKVVPGPPVAMPLASARPTSVEALLRETSVPRFILDFRELPKDSAAGTWFAKPRLHRSLGAIYDPTRANTYYWPARLAETYDGIIFIAQSTAAKPLS
jgi:erythromycin esterase